MGIFDKRTDTEKEISEFYNKPKLIIEIGKENKQEETNKEYNTNIQYKYNKAYIRAVEKFKEAKSKTRKRDVRFISTIMIIIFSMFFGSMIIAKNSSRIDVMALLMSTLAPFMIGVFLLIGFGMMFIPKIESNKKKKRCTQPVKATVLNIEKRYNGTDSNGNKSYEYIYTYQYFYLGKEYFIVTKESKRGIPTVGEEIDILINHNDPEDYFIENKLKDIISFVFSLYWIGITTIVAVLMFASYFIS